MKNLNFMFILALILSSCGTSSSFQKRKHLSGRYKRTVEHFDINQAESTAQQEIEEKDQKDQDQVNQSLVAVVSSDSIMNETNKGVKKTIVISTKGKTKPAGSKTKPQIDKHLERVNRESSSIQERTSVPNRSLDKERQGLIDEENDNPELTKYQKEERRRTQLMVGIWITTATLVLALIIWQLISWEAIFMLIHLVWVIGGVLMARRTWRRYKKNAKNIPPNRPEKSELTSQERWKRRRENLAIGVFFGVLSLLIMITIIAVTWDQ